MSYHALKSPVSNRGVPPDEFLDKQLAWGRTAASEIFAPNDNPKDIYAYIRPVLAPNGWDNLLHRRAGMLEAQRVIAGFESSWKWGEGVDKTNKHSQTHKEGEETGIFQVSFDSEVLGHPSMRQFATEHGIGTVGSFIEQMKKDRWLVFEYFARLSRINMQWDGPTKRHEIDKWLRKDAVAEYMTLLGQS